MQHSQLEDAGRTPHWEIDAHLPTDDEKVTLQNLTAGVITVHVDDTDVTNPPTDAELDGAFGTPATAGAGFVALLDDNGAGSALYLVASDGAAWWYAALTKAL